MEKKLEIEIDGVKFTAKLLEKDAPKTCRTIIKILPIESEAIHQIWSGEGIYIPCEHAFERLTVQSQRENATVYPGYGDVGWYSPDSEIFIVYGQVRWHTAEGPASCNVFAKIVDNLEKLREKGIKIRKEGAKKAYIKLKE